MSDELDTEALALVVHLYSGILRDDGKKTLGKVTMSSTRKPEAIIMAFMSLHTQYCYW